MPLLLERLGDRSQVNLPSHLLFVQEFPRSCCGLGPEARGPFQTEFDRPPNDGHEDQPIGDYSLRRRLPVTRIDAVNFDPGNQPSEGLRRLPRSSSLGVFGDGPHGLSDCLVLAGDGIDPAINRDDCVSETYDLGLKLVDRLDQLPVSHSTLR
jgi:hypothetical protein